MARILLLMSLLMLTIPLRAQGEFVPGCSIDELAQQQSTLAAFLTLEFAEDFDGSLANMFRLGALYKRMALLCGYAPNDVEVNQLLEQALMFVSLEDLIAAQSVGTDIQAILLELDGLYGDPLRGQSLYNGLEPALGGTVLGCSSCHENEAVAPLTAGTWTRINDIRLALPQYADYSHRQFLIESIVQPMAYITPDYAGMMPEFYGGQLTPQQLADLAAFLDSQDQLLDGE